MTSLETVCVGCGKSHEVCLCSISPHIVSPLTRPGSPTKVEGLDMVNNPPHYNNHPSGVECITIIREAPRHNVGVAIKYLWRLSWGKGPKATTEQNILDLKKAIWHCQDELKCMEKEMEDGPRQTNHAGGSDNPERS